MPPSGRSTLARPWPASTYASRPLSRSTVAHQAVTNDPTSSRSGASRSSAVSTPAASDGDRSAGRSAARADAATIAAGMPLPMTSATTNPAPSAVVVQS
ncbi:Uncharacterised protein [Mycobacteroides abscessus]|nr:Uncharacterised protein [Mycobacteroides abscessus]